MPFAWFQLDGSSNAGSSAPCGRLYISVLISPSSRTMLSFRLTRASLSPGAAVFIPLALWPFLTASNRILLIAYVMCLDSPHLDSTCKLALERECACGTLPLGIVQSSGRVTCIRRTRASIQTSHLLALGTAAASAYRAVMQVKERLGVNLLAGEQQDTNRHSLARAGSSVDDQSHGQIFSSFSGAYAMPR